MPWGQTPDSIAGSREWLLLSQEAEAPEEGVTSWHSELLHGSVEGSTGARALLGQEFLPQYCC